VITGCKGEGKSKQRIKEDIENVIKKTSRKLRSNIVLVLVEIEEGSGKKKSDETKRKTERKEEN
jgi:hypothetical protein